MPDLQADTHAMAVTGAGPAAAVTDAIIGGAAIILPAGGPWTIFQLWCHAVQDLLAAGEAAGGHIRINAPAGDIEPNPAPSRFPVPKASSLLGATAPVQVSPLVLHEVDWKAPGKSSIEFIYQEDTAVATAGRVTAGIIFGKTRPVLKPFKYCDRMRVQNNTAAEFQVGQIILAEKATKIVAVACMVVQDNVLTVAEAINGICRLGSDDVKMPPMQLPLSAAFTGGLGATIGQALMIPPVWIPVLIPVEGGARIDGFVDLDLATTNNVEADIFIAYE